MCNKYIYIYNIYIYTQLHTHILYICYMSMYMYIIYNTYKCIYKYRQIDRQIDRYRLVLIWIYLSIMQYMCIYIYIYICIYIYIYIRIQIYIHCKKSPLILMSPLTILIHLRVVDLPCLQQSFDDCLFQVSFCMYNFTWFLHVTLL